MLVSSSCQEPNAIAPLEDVVQENLKDIEFAQGNLKFYAQSVLAMQNESGFRADLYAAVEEAFDGEKNVLFKTLMDDSRNPKNARSLKDNLQQLNSNALTAFNNIEGNNYYPQVYIPFYDELKALGKLGKEKPHLVVYTHDSPSSLYQSYTTDKHGNLIADRLVSEDFAKNNEVWVVSINERVNDQGLVISKADNERAKTSASPSAIVDQIKCKCHKESWAAGASEVNIITAFSDFGFFDYGINFYGKGENEGGEIYKFSRSDVSNERNKDVNFFILNDWDERAPTKPYASYVIFEYDTWPTRKREVSWELGSATLSWEYRSADGYYDKQTVFKNNFSSHSVNNGCIEWRSQYQ
ncbi:MAG: hypothetical protein DYG99_06910 [Bacteroidetes bacterium CHB5]|nr:hypothetical protein [Bacteroidetes bacterium CHB5]